VVQHLADLISWLEPHALLLALALPPVIRIVGHWIPEELFMVSMGVLASRAGGPQMAFSILGAVILSQFMTDQSVYLVGRYLRPRLRRFPRVERRIGSVTERLAASPSALLGFIPARVLPLGRGAWLVGCGVVRIPWPRFVGIDIAALTIHLAVWSGLGWWLSGDLQLLARSSEMGKLAGTWLAIALISCITIVILWRRREGWQPATVRAMRRAGRSLRGLGREG
jgi:membrane protein DedA with SNARE-associated domain